MNFHEVNVTGHQGSDQEEYYQRPRAFRVPTWSPPADPGSQWQKLRLPDFQLARIRASGSFLLNIKNI